MMQRCSTLLAIVLFACSTTTETITKSNPETVPEGDAGTIEDSGTTESDAKAPVKDAGADAPAAASWGPGQAGSSCADACQAAGKTCSATCPDYAMSCGGHDGVTGPYAGYACYYRKTTSGGTTNVSNEGRSLKTCDAVATPKWDYFGSEYQIGLESNIFANPVACCCR